jgi:signal transduction histidine kinase/HPt (histidine-containing phosphotransfer) domain-containing protein
VTFESSGEASSDSSGAQSQDARERALWEGRLSAVYSLARLYLFVPFAALCMAVAPMRQNAALFWLPLPFLLHIVAMYAGNRQKERFEKRDPLDDPRVWARRFTIMSGISGAIWGLGAVIWFDFSSFAAEAYLVLAFLGLSATEFIARAAYRPAYLAHAVGSLMPLAVLLTIQGGVYQALSAMLVIYFGGVLYSYGGAIGDLLDKGVLLRFDHGALIERLSQEKRAAEATRDAAKDNDRAKSAFVSNISHELRTPMNAILGMAQLLERSDLEKAQRDHVKVLLEAGRGLKVLLDDIIALASLGEEPLIAPVEGCDAAQAARTVARLLQPNAWEKRLRLSVNIAPSLPRVAADPRLIRRVLLKLIGNAIKFTDRGNVEIALDAIEDQAGHAMVRAVITDTGPGIPTNRLTAIFEPFAKSESYSSQTAGAGVGLAVTKRLIESTGGTVGVESEPGMGARFWITVPALGTAAPEETGTMEPVTPPSGLSLLAYLPDGPIRTSIAQLLSPFGNRITFADTLAQALAMSSRGNFAAVLAAGGGVDALASAPGQRIPILGVVSYQERLPDGADGVLRWPTSPDRLYAAIHAVTGDLKADDAKNADENSVDSMIDAKAISKLEKSLGLKTLIDILQSYLATAEGLATELADATSREDWAQAGRLAQDFAGAAGGLGLTAIATAARALAQGARDGTDVESLAAATNAVLSEHTRVHDALHRLYPDLSA